MKSENPGGRRGIAIKQTCLNVAESPRPVNTAWHHLRRFAELVEMSLPALLDELDPHQDLYRKSSGHPLVRPEAAARLIQAQWQEVGNV